jgi:transposase-like protein
MSKSRRKYSAEFKREAVQLTLEPGRTVGEIAANLGISPGLLQRWRSQMKAHGPDVFPGNGRPKASDEELLRLKKDFARVQQERDILKKALAYFAKERS